MRGLFSGNRWVGWRRRAMEDSGLRYCVAHHGFIDGDQDVCDFARMDDAVTECISRPLLYPAAGARS